MKSEVLKQNLNAIREYISGIKGLKESSEAKLIRSQLHVIEKSIRQFERDGIQVPEGIMSDKASLESKIEEIKKGPQEISLLYQELLDIIIQTGRILKRRPDRDLHDRIRESRKQGEAMGSGFVNSVLTLPHLHRICYVLGVLTSPAKPSAS